MLAILGVDASLLSKLRRQAAITNWGGFALSVARRLGPAEELVLYGFGRNGSEAGRALSKAGVPFLVIDDRPDAAVGLRRIQPGELEPHHVVLITPDDREGILQRLRAVHARIVMPEALAPTGIAA